MAHGGKEGEDGEKTVLVGDVLGTANHLLAMLGECSALCRDRSAEDAKLTRPLSMLPSQEPEEESP